MGGIGGNVKDMNGSTVYVYSGLVKPHNATQAEIATIIHLIGIAAHRLSVVIKLLFCRTL